jgi:hypothetical protein
LSPHLLSVVLGINKKAFFMLEPGVGQALGRQPLDQRVVGKDLSKRRVGCKTMPPTSDTPMGINISYK